MHHINTRQKLIEHVARTTRDLGIREAIYHGGTISWGRFEGGWVLETRFKRGKLLPPPIYVGVKPDGACGQRLIHGRLSAIPWADYLGGETEVDRGDLPEDALRRKREASVPSC